MKTTRPLIKLLMMVAVLAVPRAALALDSYRYLHVTIETPWYIFIFLLPIVLSPLILLVVLYWWYSFRRRTEKPDAETGNVGESSEIK